MLDGTYVVEVNTPLGRKTGKITLTTQDERVFVDVDAPVLGKKRLEGHAQGDSFIVEGTWKLLVFGKIEYTVEGKLYGDDLALSVKTSKGSTEAVGIRI